jgi:hypothetical protein
MESLLCGNTKLIGSWNEESWPTSRGIELAKLVPKRHNNRKTEEHGRGFMQERERKN